MLHMKHLTLLVLAGGATALFAAVPLGAAIAQPDDVASPAPAEHGNWTLKQRENWLHSRLDKAKDDGGLSHDEYDRVHDELSGIQKDEDDMRDHHHGQLTDNETAELEVRLDKVANDIHWLHEKSFQTPW
jgi:hypothetical protein